MDGPVYLIYDIANDGYQYIRYDGVTGEFNPLYWGEGSTFGYQECNEYVIPADVVDGIGYPREFETLECLSLYLRYDLTYGCYNPTPTPTPTSGVIFPTPTPTPSVTASLTVTPTPSPTFVCSCTSYSVVNNGGTSATVNYTDCTYTPQSFSLAGGSGLSFCACADTVTSTGRDVVITNLGECVPVTPTPSPTPTPPFTPTPSPTFIP